MELAAALTTTMTIVWVFAGIIISLILPVAVGTLRKSTKLEGLGDNPSFGERIAAVWKKYGGGRYLKIGIAAAVIAVALVFLLGLDFSNTRDAVLAGFAWESLIGKLMGAPE